MWTSNMAIGESKERINQPFKKTSVSSINSRIAFVWAEIINLIKAFDPSLSYSSLEILLLTIAIYLMQKTTLHENVSGMLWPFVEF